MSGNLLSAVFDPCTTTVGSSGALYGLLGGLVPFAVGEDKGLGFVVCKVGSLTTGLGGLAFRI